MSIGDAVVTNRDPLKMQKLQYYQLSCRENKRSILLLMSVDDIFSSNDVWTEYHHKIRYICHFKIRRSGVYAMLG